jgi:glycosyltransferase involved in cell wall biosynthesis
LVQAVADKGLESSVYFLNEDKVFPEKYDAYFVMRDFYQMTDALLFTSSREGFGIPMIEAGIVNMPVVCSDLGVFHEIGGTDVFYLNDDYDQVDFTALQQFVTDTPQYKFRKEILRAKTLDAIYTNRLKPLINGSNR